MKKRKKLYTRTMRPRKKADELCEKEIYANGKWQSEAFYIIMLGIWIHYRSCDMCVLTTICRTFHAPPPLVFSPWIESKIHWKWVTGRQKKTQHNMNNERWTYPKWPNKWTIEFFVVTSVCGVMCLAWCNFTLYHSTASQRKDGSENTSMCEIEHDMTLKKRACTDAWRKNSHIIQHF